MRDKILTIKISFSTLQFNNITIDVMFLSGRVKHRFKNLKFKKLHKITSIIQKQGFRLVDTEFNKHECILTYKKEN